MDVFYHVVQPEHVSSRSTNGNYIQNRCTEDGGDHRLAATVVGRMISWAAMMTQHDSPTRNNVRINQSPTSVAGHLAQADTVENDCESRDDIFRSIECASPSVQRIESSRLAMPENICWGGWLLDKLALIPLLRMSGRSAVMRTMNDACGACLKPDLTVSFGYSSSDESTDEVLEDKASNRLLHWESGVSADHSVQVLSRTHRDRAYDRVPFHRSSHSPRQKTRTWSQSGCFINFIEDGVEVSVDTSGLDFDISDPCEPSFGKEKPDDCSHVRVLDRIDRLERKGDLFDAISHLSKFLHERLDSTISDIAHAEMQHRLGVLHWKLGNYSSSLAALNSSCSQYERVVGHSVLHEELLDCNPHQGLAITAVLNSIGRVHVSRSEYDTAMFYFHNNVRILDRVIYSGKKSGVSEAIYRASQVSRARTILLIGTVHESKGSLNIAMTCYRQSLRVGKLYLGDRHVDVAASKSRVAAVHEKRGKLSKAIKCYKQAIGIYNNQWGDSCSPVDVAVLQNNIGFIYYLWGKYEKALEQYQQALCSLKQTVGNYHRNVASTHFYISLVYRKQGKETEALLMLQAALHCQRELLVPHHSDIAVTLDAIGKTYMSLNQHAHAVKFLVRALRVYQKTLGQDHIVVGEVFDHLGTAHFHSKKFKKAEWSFQQAIQVYESNQKRPDRVDHIKRYLSLNGMKGNQLN